MMFLRPVVMRDAATTAQVTNERYDNMRALQQRLQPADNVMLNGVDAAPVIPERPILAPPPSQSKADERPPLQGTALIPPPTLPVQRLAPSVLKGALPPTSDPATWRELP